MTTLNTLDRSNSDNARHMNNLIIALLSTANLDKIYSHAVSIALETNFGIVVNWHDSATALDELATKGKILRSGINSNGNALYELKTN